MTEPTDHRAATAASRFWAKVQGGDVTECWVWTGAKSTSGYGSFGFEGTRTTGAHRWAYESLIGPIPDGLELDHLCRSRACVNPWHLDPVTLQVNAQRGKRPSQTHCLRGHPYSEANTYWHGRNHNQRACRECDRERQRKRYQQAKAVAA